MPCRREGSDTRPDSRQNDPPGPGRLRRTTDHYPLTNVPCQSPHYAVQSIHDRTKILIPRLTPSRGAMSAQPSRESAPWPEMSAIGRIFQNFPPRPVLSVVGCARTGPAVMFPDSTTCSGTLNADGCCLSSPGTTRCPAFSSSAQALPRIKNSRSHVYPAFTEISTMAGYVRKWPDISKIPPALPFAIAPCP